MIKAIETVYNGYRFRSRLEARWAVFFEALKVPYRYEVEGYELATEQGTTLYLPDFWLPDQRCYVEVKGQLTSSGWPLAPAQDKAARLCVGDKHPVLFLGDVPNVPDERLGSVTASDLLKPHPKWDPPSVVGFLPGFEDQGPPWPKSARLHWKNCFFCGAMGLEALYIPWSTCGCFQRANDLWPWPGEGVPQITALWDDHKHERMVLDYGVRNAYRAARQARFEHGEKGTHV